MPRPFFSHAAIFGQGGLSMSAPISTTSSVTIGHDIIPVDGTAGAITVTLPLAAVSKRGRQIYFVKLDAANNVTIQRAGADVIGNPGVTNVVLNTQGQVLHLVSNGDTLWLRLQG
jgi:hypothetical protein